MTEDYLKRIEENKNTLKAANAANKEAVFNSLHAANITHVEIEFDGEGDSGGITNKTAHSGKIVVSIPTSPVKVALGSGVR